MVGLPILVAVAVVMSAVIILLIRAFLGIHNVLQARLVIFGVGMMVAMFVGAALYVAYPSGLMLAYVVGANMLVMVVGLVYILGGLEVFVEGGGGSRKPTMKDYNKYFTILLILNEASMGFTFVEAQGHASWLHTADTRVLPAHIVTASVNTYWFFIPLFAEMASAAYFNRRRAADAHYGILAATLFSPTSFNNPYWGAAALIAQLAATAYFAQRCFRVRVFGDGVYYLLALAASSAASYTLHYSLLYAIMSVIAVGWFFTTILRPAYSTGTFKS